MSDHSQLPAFLRITPPPTTPPSKERLQALYASTSTQRTTNPTGYSANSQWWAGVLEETLRSGWINGEGGDRLVLKVDEALLARLEDAKGARPRGIGGVIETLSTTNSPTLHPSQHFFSSLTPLHASPSLTSRFIGRPLWWAVSQLNPFGSSTDKVEKEETLWSKYGKGKEYVHIPLLEQSATAFMAYVNKNPILSYTDSLFDLDSFRETYGEACIPAGSGLKKLPKGKHALSKRDVEVLTKWLSRDCSAVVTDGLVVKVLDVDQTASDHPITEADRGAVSVLNALKKVEKQILGIEEQIEQSQEKAKKHLSLGQKNIALSYLRSKKQLEELLSKRVASSEQLRAVIRSIDQAKGDVEILAAYETSTATLSSVLAHPSLSPDRIAETTDALAEAMANQEEIDEAVRVGGEIAMGNKRVEVDEDELASELEEMVREEKEAAKAKADADAQLAKQKEQEKKKGKEKSTAQTTTAEREDTREKRPKNKTEFSRPAEAKKDDEQEEDVWNKRYEEAQLRKDAEKQRAEAERSQRDAKRVAAE